MFTNREAPFQAGDVGSIDASYRYQRRLDRDMALGVQTGQTLRKREPAVMLTLLSHVKFQVGTTSECHKGNP